MQGLHKSFSLRKYNSFGLDISTEWFFSFDKIEYLKQLAEQNPDVFNKRKLILGGGSNLLFTKKFDGLILFPLMNSIEIVDENSYEVFIKVDAGLVWDQFVEWTVDKGYYGIENLSLIPGHVGATPIQNIGAYGTEIKDILYSVNIIELENLKEKKLNNLECGFGYRNSIFKTVLKDRFLVKSVIYKLSKKPNFILNYGNLDQEIKKYGKLNLKTVREAVINIRQSKLPDPKKIGNAGSFFKNPVISNEKLRLIIERYPEIPIYPFDENNSKIAAGWLIDKCGWKGKSRKNVGVHEKQALVLINYGKAKGFEILELAKEIQKSVLSEFNVHLEPEVIYI